MMHILTTENEECVMYSSRTVRSTGDARVRMRSMVAAVGTVRAQDWIVGNVIKVRTVEPRASECCC
jgi:hypothetical protein